MVKHIKNHSKFFVFWHIKVYSDTNISSTSSGLFDLTAMQQQQQQALLLFKEIKLPHLQTSMTERCLQVKSGDPVGYQTHTFIQQLGRCLKISLWNNNKKRFNFNQPENCLIVCDHSPLWPQHLSFPLHLLSWHLLPSDVNIPPGAELPRRSSMSLDFPTN